MKTLQMPFAMNWWNSLATDKKNYYTKKYLNNNKDSNTLTVFEILYLHKKTNNN